MIKSGIEKFNTVNALVFHARLVRNVGRRISKNGLSILA